MKHLRSTVASSIAVLSLSLVVSAANAQEHRLNRSQLPAVVNATIDKETHGAVVKRYLTEKEHGKKVYEAETIVSGHTRDLQVAEDGTLNEVEEEVQLAGLSPDVQKSLTVKAAGGAITKVESLTKKGALVAYEAVVRKGTKRSEIQVGPTGGVLAHEE